ncbi:LppA-related lipoprotein [Mycoplasma sp. 480]|uniref:LppA-related lipoprotein n=1 Tax=Mycoplasma sp. 480 TaxID=3440155 RepID=UPI003F51494C
MKKNKNHFKFWKSFIVLSPITLSLVACGQNKTEKTTNEDSIKPEQPKITNPSENTNTSTNTIPNTQTGNNNSSNNNLNNDKNTNIQQNTDVFASLKDFPTILEVTERNKELDALSFYYKYKDAPDLISQNIAIKWELQEEYKIRATFPNTDKINNSTGKISDLVLTFTKNNQDKNITISLQGFKTNSTNTVDERENFLTKKDLNGSSVIKLFASLVASMLQYNSNIDSFRELQNSSTSDDFTLNYEYLGSGNKENLKQLFKDKNIVLNPSLSALFFEKHEDSTKPKYNYEVVGVSANDLEGTMQVEVSIKQIDNNTGVTDSYHKYFEFSGFRKFAKDQNGNLISNPFSVYLLENEAIEIINKYKLKSKIENSISNMNITNEKQKITLSITNQEKDTLKNAIFNKLLIAVYDQEKEKIYNNWDNLPRATKFIARKDKTSIYPFITSITKEIIENVDFYVFKETNSEENKIIMQLELKIFPFVSSSINDLRSITFSDQEIHWTKDLIEFNLNELK